MDHILNKTKHSGQHLPLLQSPFETARKNIKVNIKLNQAGGQAQVFSQRNVKKTVKKDGTKRKMQNEKIKFTWPKT